MMPTKKCNKCGENKDLTLFFSEVNCKSGDGHFYSCKECVKVSRKLSDENYLERLEVKQCNRQLWQWFNLVGGKAA